MKLWHLFIHLRLHWQIMLAPLFMWGFLIAGGEISPRFWATFFVFHVMFYGGATALNSYYDQDDGPIGGLWDPPPATRALFFFSVGIQVLGMVLIFFISRPLFILAIVMGLVGTAYSHPAARLKAYPWIGWLAVGIFQGMGGTAAGWLAATDDWTTLLSWQAALSLLANCLIVLAYFPLTQIYQREQDQRKGDISFAVRLGERCFPLSIVNFSLSAALMGILTWGTLSWLSAVVIVIGLLGLALLAYIWWQRYDEKQVRRNYVWMMQMGYLMTASFLSYIIYHLLGGWTPPAS